MRLAAFCVALSILLSGRASRANDDPEPAPAESSEQAPPQKSKVVGGLFLSPGVMLARTSADDWRFDAELSLFYGGSGPFWGMGAALGGNPERFYAELQPMFSRSFGASHNIAILGTNAGILVDWAGPVRKAAQFTIWPQVIIATGETPLPLPLVPFVRFDVFASDHVATSVGLMLKLPAPIWWKG